MIKLIPLAMIYPSPGDKPTYAPSKLETSKVVGWGEFAEFTPRDVQVSFSADCLSAPEKMTVWGKGLDCYYLAEVG